MFSNDNLRPEIQALLIENHARGAHASNSGNEYQKNVCIAEGIALKLSIEEIEEGIARYSEEGRQKGRNGFDNATESAFAQGYQNALASLLALEAQDNTAEETAQDAPETFSPAQIKRMCKSRWFESLMWLIRDCRILQATEISARISYADFHYRLFKHERTRKNNRVSFEYNNVVTPSIKVSHIEAMFPVIVETITNELIEDYKKQLERYEACDDEDNAARVEIMLKRLKATRLPIAEGEEQGDIDMNAAIIMHKINTRKGVARHIERELEKGHDRNKEVLLSAVRSEIETLENELRALQPAQGELHPEAAARVADTQPEAAETQNELCYKVVMRLDDLNRRIHDLQQTKRSDEAIAEIGILLNEVQALETGNTDTVRRMIDNALNDTQRTGFERALAFLAMLETEQRMEARYNESKEWNRKGNKVFACLAVLDVVQMYYDAQAQCLLSGIIEEETHTYNMIDTASCAWGYLKSFDWKHAGTGKKRTVKTIPKEVYNQLRTLNSCVEKPLQDADKFYFGAQIDYFMHDLNIDLIHTKISGNRAMLLACAREGKMKAAFEFHKWVQGYLMAARHWVETNVRNTNLPTPNEHEKRTYEIVLESIDKSLIDETISYATCGTELEARARFYADFGANNKVTLCEVHYEARLVLQ